VESDLTFTMTIPAPGEYQLENWHIAARDPHTITFRPSLKTLFQRLAITLVAVIAVGVLATIRDQLSGLGALPGNGDAVAMVISIGIWALMGFAGLVGILSPLSTLWQRVKLSRGVRGTLKFRAYRILTTRHEWPLETGARRGGGPRQHRGYLWSVGVVDQNGQWCVDLQVDREKHGPLEGRLSERTRQCVEALQRITGLHFGGMPIVIEHDGTPRAMNDSSDTMPGTTHVTERRGNVTKHVTTSTESHTYHSLDEMPPEIRARVEAVMAQGRSSGAETFVSEQITIADENGTRTYNSVDEMPPDVRARYEEARRKFRRE